MAVLTVHYYCDSIQMTSLLYIAMPDEPPRDENGYPTVLLLAPEGAEGDRWMKEAPLERWAKEKHLAFVMPATLQGCYTDMAYGYRFFEAIAREIPAFLKRNLPCLNMQSDLSVAGISMGAAAAVRLALTEPFIKKAAVFSGRLDPASSYANPLDNDWLTPKRMLCLWGDDGPAPGDANDLFAAAEKALAAEMKPELYLAAAPDDPGFKSCERFVEAFAGALEIQWYPRSEKLGWPQWVQELRLWLDA